MVDSGGCRGSVARGREVAEAGVLLLLEASAESRCIALPRRAVPTSRNMHNVYRPRAQNKETEREKKGEQERRLLSALELLLCREKASKRP